MPCRYCVKNCNFDILERYPEEHELEGQLVLGEVELLNCVPQAKISFVDDLENFGTCHAPRAEVTRRWKWKAKMEILVIAIKLSLLNHLH